jgi:WD40 repeat protein
MGAAGRAPQQLFAVKTPSGCGAVASTGSLAACATLGAVELYGASGEALGALKVVPPVWQHAVAFLSRTRLAAGGDDRLLRVWNTESRALEGEPIALPSEVRALAPMGSGVLLGLRDGSLVQVELPSGALTVLATLEAPIRAVATDGLTTLAATREGFVWSAGMVPKLVARNAPTGAVAFASPGVPLAGVMRSVVDVASGRPADGHTDDVTALVVQSPNRWVSGGGDGTVRWWSSQGRELADAGKGVVVVAARDRRLEAWRLPPEADAPVPFAAPAVSLAWFPEGWVVAGLSNGWLQKLELEDRQVQTLELAHVGPVRALARVPQPQAPASIRLLTGGDDGKVKVQRWNGEVDVLEASSHKVRAVAAAPEGARVAWALDDGTLVLFSLETMKEISRTEAVAASAIAFAPRAEQLVALARDDRRVSLLDAETGAEMAALDGHDGAVTAVAFAPTGRLLATGSADTTVRVWDAQTRQEISTLHGPSERVGAVAFSQDGQHLVAGSDDGNLYLWSLVNARLEAVLRLHLGDVSLVAFAGPDVLVAAGSDRTVRVLSLAASATPPGRAPAAP